ncbi:MAG: hypothetical protein PVJ09_01855 [Candidatus Woesebacteria bacterium]|jgi:hypothetical protein
MKKLTSLQKFFSSLFLLFQINFSALISLFFIVQPVYAQEAIDPQLSYDEVKNAIVIDSNADQALDYAVYFVADGVVEAAVGQVEANDSATVPFKTCSDDGCVSHDVKKTVVKMLAEDESWGQAQRLLIDEGKLILDLKYDITVTSLSAGEEDWLFAFSFTGAGMTSSVGGDSSDGSADGSADAGDSVTDSSLGGIVFRTYSCPADSGVLIDNSYRPSAEGFDDYQAPAECQLSPNVNFAYIHQPDKVYPDFFSPYPGLDEGSVYDSYLGMTDLNAELSVELPEGGRYMLAAVNSESNLTRLDDDQVFAFMCSIDSGGQYDNNYEAVYPFAGMTQYCVTYGTRAADRTDLTVCKENADGELMADWQMTLTQLNPVLYQSLTIDSSDPDGEDSLVLEDGKRYQILVSGEWLNDEDRVDAEYYSDDDWQNYDDIADNLGRDDRQFDLVIDNQNVDWGTYNANHQYETLVDGTANALNFRVFDEDLDLNKPSWYSNNTGSLTVEIYELADLESVSQVTGENGCTSFLNLPAGDYRVSEEERNNWQRQSDASNDNVPVDGSITLDGEDQTLTFVNAYSEPVVEEPSPTPTATPTPESGGGDDADDGDDDDGGGENNSGDDNGDSGDDGASDSDDSSDDSADTSTGDETVAEETVAVLPVSNRYRGWGSQVLGVEEEEESEEEPTPSPTRVPTPKPLRDQGAVAGVTDNCSTGTQYLPWILLLIQLVLMLASEYVLRKDASHKKLVLMTGITLASILLFYLLRDCECLAGNFLSWLCKWYWLPAGLLALSTKILSYLLIEETAVKKK